MICPVEIAGEMSALRAARVGDHAKHGLLPEGRDGAGDESTGCDVAGDGEEDYLVAGGRDTGHQRPPQCDGFGSDTSKTAITGYSTGGGASPHVVGYQWRRWRRCSRCSGRSISI